jgi:hypothetical protein
MNTTQRLASLIQNQFRVILVGPPGTAKTARVQAAAASLGWRFFYGIDGRTADLMDRLDAAGAVVPDTAAGVARTLPLQALKDILDCRVPAVWFVDEIGRSPVDVQGALCSVVDRLRRENSPVVVVAATNRPQDKAGVASLSEQLRSRFDLAFSIATPDADTKVPGGAVYLTDWQGEVEGWCDYAADAGFHPAVIAWHRSTGGTDLYKWKPSADPALRMADYRAWEVVNRLVRTGITDVDSVAAVIGRGPAVTFTAFLDLAVQLPTPQQVWSDPLGAKVPESVSAQFFISSVLAGVATEKSAWSFIRYVERLPRHLTAFAVRDIHRRLGAKLAKVPEWNGWFAANAELFR